MRLVYKADLSPSYVDEAQDNLLIDAMSALNWHLFFSSLMLALPL
jgi:hypothetical protein